MEVLAQSLCEFLSAKKVSLATATTREVMSALRGHFDETVPGWRDTIFESYPEKGEGDSVSIDLHLTDGRVIRGVLLQKSHDDRANGEM